MPRRIRKKTSIFAPAGNLLKRLADSDQRTQRRMQRLSLWGLGLFFAYTLMIGTYSIPRIVRLQWQRNALREANQQHVVNLIDAARLRDLLHSNADYLEELARTRYYMVRPDETVYRYRGR